jgi:hypothetical protein
VEIEDQQSPCSNKDQLRVRLIQAVLIPSYLPLLAEKLSTIVLCLLCYVVGCVHKMAKPDMSVDPKITHYAYPCQRFSSGNPEHFCCTVHVGVKFLSSFKSSHGTSWHILSASARISKGQGYQGFLRKRPGSSFGKKGQFA